MRALVRRRLVRWGVPAALGLVGVAYTLISFLIAQGVTKSDREEQEDHPTAHGLAFEDVEFLSRRGDVTLSGWWVPAEGDGPVLIFVHGIGSKRSGDGAVVLAASLHQRGFSALLFDLRGHGSSEGDQVSGGDHERADVLGAFDFLTGMGVSAERIGLMGFSMGAGTSLMAAAQEPAIRAVVADSPFATASDLIAQETARKTVIPKWLVPVFLPVSKLMARQFYGINLGALKPEESVAQLGYPVLVVHGDADERIPVEHGQRVFEAAHPGSELWVVPDVDHVDAFLTYPEEYVRRVGDYFAARLGVTGTPAE